LHNLAYSSPQLTMILHIDRPIRQIQENRRSGGWVLKGRHGMSRFTNQIRTSLEKGRLGVILQTSALRGIRLNYSQMET